MTESEPARVPGALDSLEDAVLALFLGTLIVLACLQIALRNLFDTGIDWIGPLVRHLVFWLGLLGALVAARRGQHIAIDAFSRLLARRQRSALAAAIATATAIVCACVAVHGARLVVLDHETGGTAFGSVPSWCVEAAIPLCFGGMALCYAWSAVEQARRAIVREDAA